MHTRVEQRALQCWCAHACSHPHTAASAAVLLRMAAAPSAARRSTRASQQPLSFAEEQSESICSAVQLHALSEVLLLSPAAPAGREVSAHLSDMRERRWKRREGHPSMRQRRNAAPVAATHPFVSTQ